ncbi:MAG: YdcF family protein [Pseudomonadota bacterium]
MSWFLTNLVSAFLLPPLNLLLVAGIGLLLWHKRPRLARSLLIASFAALWLLSTPYVAEGLLHTLEGPPYDRTDEPADAIVILGGGQRFDAIEYGGNTVSQDTLERLRYGATLQHKTGTPILVSGGAPQGGSAEARLMQQVLEQEFHTPVRWVEPGSDNTQQNAEQSRRLLATAGITRVYLVTQAWHMPRASAAFERAGLQVVPAPTAWTTRYRTTLLTFLPDGRALRKSYWFMHEIIGLLWYKLKS